MAQAQVQVKIVRQPRRGKDEAPDPPPVTKKIRDLWFRKEGS